MGEAHQGEQRKVLRQQAGALTGF